MNETRIVALTQRNRIGTRVLLGAHLFLAVAISATLPRALAQPCPLPVSPIVPVCQAREAIDCTTGVAGDTCVPLTLSRDGSNNIIFVNQCTCADSFNECGPINITGTGASTSLRCALTCDGTADPCNIHIDGVSTGVGNIFITDFAVDSMVTCGCDAQVNTCNPQGGTFWCADLIDTDCVGGTGTDTCYQTALTVGANGQPVIGECACFEGGQCGIITIVENPPGTVSPFTFVCEKNCPDPNDTCEVHLDGVPQGTVVINSNQLTPNQVLSCACVPPVTVCPLSPVQSAVSCANLQSTQCTNPLNPSDECRPTQVSIAADGTLVADACACGTPGLDCSSSLNVIADAAGQLVISCDAQCPDPTQACLVHVNGVSTIASSIPASSLNPGDVAICDCTPVDIGACCRDIGTAAPACVDPISEPDCLAVGGVFFGGGAVCLGVEACCNPTDGTCTDVDALCCTDMGGIPQGAGTDCTMPNICNPPVCPMPNNITWCADLQFTDCIATSGGTSCLPSAVAIDPLTGILAINACECFLGECGPVTIKPQPGAFPPYIFVCENNCPDPNETCEVHIDGVPQGVVTLGSNWVPNGQEVTCGCVQPDPPCPLPSDPTTIPLCQNNMADCTNPSSTTDECLPTVVSIASDGTLVADTCKCLTPGDVCAAVTPITDATGVVILSCEAQCPDPTTQTCLVFVNGMSTGLTEIPQSSLVAGDAVICDCEPQTTGACCFAIAAGVISCQDGISEAACDSVNGIFHPNQPCLGLVACCRPNGTCTDMDALCCADFGGLPQAPGSDCTQTVCNPPLCPLPVNDFTCANFQLTDCVATSPGTVCKPSMGSIDLATGVATVSACDCFNIGECGPVTIIDQPGAFPPFIFSCKNTCPDPNDTCEVFVDGIAQGVVELGSNWVPNGQTVSCGCVQPDPPCPLPSNSTTLPLCLNNLADCTNPTSATDECLPTIVGIGPNGTLVGGKCECLTPGEVCAAITPITDAAGVVTLSCEAQCPDPTMQTCFVFINGNSTGLTQIPQSLLAVGDTVICDCEPQSIGACCFADPAGIGGILCQDGISEMECDALNGNFHLNQTCLGTVACCRPDGTCSDIDELCCKDFGGLPQAPGTDCTLANACNPPFCPVPMNAPWCANLQFTDCDATAAGTDCLPSSVAIDPTTGGLAINSCDCFVGECGPVTIIEQPGAFPPFIFSCENNCPDPNDTCEVFIDGVSQGVTTLGSNWVPNGQEITCGCVQPDPPCPLPTGNTIPLCQNNMADCTNPASTTDQCLPTVVSIASDGTLVGDSCKCLTPGAGCDDVTPLVDAAGVVTLSCKAQCPDPTTQKCLVFVNGNSTGLTEILQGSLAAGDQVTCDCEPTSTGACCFKNAGTVSCQDGISEMECDALNGVFHLNQVCLGPVACCRPNGTCLDIDELCCKDIGGLSQGPGSDCTLANVCNPPTCPVPANIPWCADLQATDCDATAPGTDCLPSSVAIDPATGALAIKSCDCFVGECGPVTIIQQPGAFPPFVFSCENNCPNPNQSCEVHIDGVPQGVVTLGSNWVPNGQSITCGCVQPNAKCPLPTGNTIPICKKVQSTQCTTPNAATDECLPQSFVVSSSGGISGLKCECVTEGPCGPIGVTSTPIGITVSCDAACPDPTAQTCFVHQNGISTGVVTMLLSDVNPGTMITCDCVPPSTGACCFADAVGGISCQDGVTEAACDALNGIFHLNQACLGNVACCRPDGTCSNVDELCCKDFGGLPQAPGTDCTLANVCNPPFCPVPANASWCANLQPTDCDASNAGTDCLPSVVAVDPASGALAVKVCDCFVGECGPVTIFEQPGAFPPFIFTCENNCPAADDSCEIHIDGVPQGVVSIGSDVVPNGQAVSCGCVPPVQFCPLPSNAIPLCQNNLADCTNPSAVTDECLPTEVTIADDGTLIGQKCRCLTPGDVCAAVTAIDTAAGAELSCVAQCPDPTAEKCLVQINGMSTGLDTIPQSAIGLGDVVTCACVTPPVPCVVAQPPLPEPVPASKNRFISFVPTNPGVQTALRVTLVSMPGPFAVWNGAQMWVRNPHNVTESGSSGGPAPAPTFLAANMQCNPDCRDWGALGRIDVYSEAIVPGARYTVEAVDCQCDLADPASYSAPLLLNTSAAGDVVGNYNIGLGLWTPPNGSVDIVADAVAVLQKFASLPTAPRKARVDLEPACLDLIINITDIVEIINAFSGGGYSFVPMNPAAHPCLSVCP